MDFAGLFRFDVSPLELVVRGTLLYWFLFALFRFVLRRDTGSIAIADILLLVLIADASQNAMAGGYTSVGEGLVLVSTIAGWNWVLDWAAWRFDAVRRIVEPGPLQLVRHGRILRDNLRRELLTIDELHAKLRQQGVEDIAQVKAAYLESDGSISVIQRDGGPPAQGAPRQTTLP
jgi:uncharacterized membrane protein YcaP (DUF421 family)